MSQKTTIEWTDASWNPVRGCVKVSPGCRRCYAETFAERFRGVPGHPYEQGFDPRLVPEQLDAPLRWRKPRRIFVNSMSDIFQEAVTDDYIAACFGVMACCDRRGVQRAADARARREGHAARRRPRAHARAVDEDLACRAAINEKHDYARAEDAAADLLEALDIVIAAANAQPGDGVKDGAQ